MKNYNKPEYINVKREDPKDKENKEKIIEIIVKLLKDESFGVLATSDHSQSYTSLISFALSHDFRKIVFATPIDTRKFTMIENNKNISILVDNRSANVASINEIVAISSMGQGRILKEKEEIESWSKVLLDKHRYLDDFINAKTTAIVLVDISNYYYVSSFQEVIQWSPQD